MTLYLHIGMPKTGTTTIQTFLDRNREKLAERGVIVPTSPGSQNHRKLTMHALEDSEVDHTRRMMGLLTPEAVIKFRAAFEKSFTAEAATWPAGSTVVMTGENMSQFRQAGEIRRLHSLVQAVYAGTIKIIVYFRRQDLFYLSSYSQQIKAGRQTHWSEQTGDIRARFYDYGKFLAPWAAQFGSANIIVRVFERSQMVRQDLLADFMAAVGLDDLNGLEIPESRNQSLDTQTVEYLRQLNQWYPRYIDGLINMARRPLVAAMEEISDGPRLQMAAADARRFLARFEQSNAAVARQYLGRDDGILFRDKPDDSVEAPPSLSVEQAMAISAKLLMRMQNPATLPVASLEELPDERLARKARRESRRRLLSEQTTLDSKVETTTAVIAPPADGDSQA